MTSRKIIIEPHPDGLLAMDERGNVARFSDPERAVKAISRSAAAESGKTGQTIVTTIEWRNMPEGFVPPTLEVRS